MAGFMKWPTKPNLLVMDTIYSYDFSLFAFYSTMCIKQRTNILWFQFLSTIKLLEATNFFDFSYIKVAPPPLIPDFGSTLAYDSNNRNLLVGAPFSDKDGKLYSCPLQDLPNITCSEISIDIDKQVPRNNRSQSPEQHYGLGSAIAVTPDYIFTCAPLVTMNFRTHSGTKFGASGMCFTYNGTTVNNYYGLADQYNEEMDKIGGTDVDINHFYGGVGWTTLADVDKKIILISKPAITSALHLMDMEKPLTPIKNQLKTGVSNSLYYKGRAFAYGNFFEDFSRLYAFSAEMDSTKKSVIAFLSYDESTKNMNILTDENKLMSIHDPQEGSMFGATLHSARLGPGTYTDLLVGAPAQRNVEFGYDNGAVHIYLGGIRSDNISNIKTMSIFSIKDGSRFGTSVATADLDNDGYQEIFVSAPYEQYEGDGEGVIYVIYGHEMYQLLKDEKPKVPKVPLSDLVYTQRIKSAELQTLGFSLQVLPASNYQGDYYLAIGSPTSGKVALYHSIPLVTVNVTTQLKGVERVRQLDNNFTMSVTVTITYPSEISPIRGKILVSTSIVGEEAYIKDNSSYEIPLADKPSVEVTDIDILLKNHKRGIYKFTATVKLDDENLTRTDFTQSLVELSPRSKITNEFSLVRECKEEEKSCEPNLSLTFQWSGSNKTHYALGHTAEETMSIVIRNDGGATYGSCAYIRVTGAQISYLHCSLGDGWYKCDLMNIDIDTSVKLKMTLDMSKPTNKDQRFIIDVKLYNKCTSQKISGNYTEMISYEFNTDEIYMNSTHFDQFITDRDVRNVDTGPYIYINELFTITNKGDSMYWSSLPLDIVLQEEPFIKDYLWVCRDRVTEKQNSFVCPLAIKVQVDSGDCKSNELKRTYNCTIDLQPNSTLKVKSIVTIFKDKIKKSLQDQNLKIYTNFTVHMLPTVKTIKHSYVTEVPYKKTIGVKNNIYFVIAIAALIGVLVMIIIAIALFKGGFFQRETKRILVDLKHEHRKQSIIRPNPANVPKHVLEALHIKPEQSNTEETVEQVNTENKKSQLGVNTKSQINVNEDENDENRDSALSFL